MSIKEIDELFQKYINCKQTIKRYVSKHWEDTDFESSVYNAIHRDDDEIDSSTFKIIVKKCKLTKTIMNRIINYIISNMEAEALLYKLFIDPYEFA